MLTIASLLIASTVSLQPATTVVLGQVERDLTGDGKPETLRVVGVGPTIDNLDATFTIESAGKTVYTFKLAPLNRTVGFDAGRRMISAEQHRVRLKQFERGSSAKRSFSGRQSSSTAFADRRACTWLKFPTSLPATGRRPRHGAGGEIWDEILKSPVTIFTFSPGGDAIVAIGWSARAGRFYRLLECC